MFDYFQFRYRRQLRAWQRRRRAWRRQVGLYMERHIWGKWHQLRLVRRLLIIWGSVLVIGAVGLWGQIGVLQRLGQRLIAEPGGTYTEATVGTVQIINPILPEGTVAADCNKLIFSGLTQFNNQRQLVPDLATSWSVSKDGRTYTFNLRPGVTWQDGQPFTAADVAYTIAAIQNPDTRSPLASSWQGVTVKVNGANSVSFTLPAPLASFLDSTTVGILPSHLLARVDPAGLRLAGFNQHPVGTGPFKMQTFTPGAGEITLAANPHYYAGRPKLDNLTFRLYSQPADALAAYAKQQVNGVSQITPTELTQAQKLQGLHLTALSLPQEEMLLFRGGDSVVGDATVRQTLIRSLDRNDIVRQATAGQAIAITQPLLPGQLGYTTRYAPKSLSTKAAGQALTAAGWVIKNGVRQKGSQQLKLSLVTLSGTDLEAAAREIASQWQPLGVEVTVKPVSLTDLEQSYLRPRHYQLVLFGESLGADPDVYPYWDSSQIKDPGYNFAEYKSATADAALESGRIINDVATRTQKYYTFLQAWNNDLPAASLYQPVYLYGQDDAVTGLAAKRLNVPSDRFYGVQNWTVRQRLVGRT